MNTLKHKIFPSNHLGRLYGYSFAEKTLEFFPWNFYQNQFKNTPACRYGKITVTGATLPSSAPIQRNQNPSQIPAVPSPPMSSLHTLLNRLLSHSDTRLPSSPPSHSPCLLAHCTPATLASFSSSWTHQHPSCLQAFALTVLYACKAVLHLPMTGFLFLSQCCFLSQRSLSWLAELKVRPFPHRPFPQLLPGLPLWLSW